MPVFFAEQALLAEGWRRRVRLGVGPLGTIETIAADAPAAGAERLAGPVLPGMPNLHSHAFQRAMAGLAERPSPQGDDFWGWRQAMYALVAALTPGQVEAIARHLYVEMLKAGYTAVAEFHYLHHAADGSPYAEPAEMAQRLVAAADDAGIGLTLLPALYAQGGFGGQPPGPGQRRFVNDVAGFLALRARIPRPRHGTVGTALHSLRAVTPGQLDAVLAGLAGPNDAGPVHIHVAEQPREVADCLAWSGRRPVDWLLDHAAVDRRWCLVHATHAGPDELARIAASGAVVGLCPSTEANLGDGLFAAGPFLAAGGRFGIGSDSQVTVSAVEELRWLEYGQRLRAHGRARLARPECPSVGCFLWAQAAAAGAQALGQPVGALAVGARADLVVLDGADPLLAGCADDRILDRLVFAGSDRLVRDVIVAGRWVVRERHHALAEAAAAGFAAASRELLAA